MARSEILKNILSQQEFTVPAIAEGLGISMTTISKYVDELQSAGFVRAVGYVDTGKKGRRPVQYELCSENHYFLGVDVKSYELHLGMMNLSGEIVRTKHIPEFRFENTYVKLEEICQHTREFVAECETGGKKVLAANFNIGGRVNSQQGTSASIFNFEEAQEKSLISILNKHLGIPVYIENDSKSMAYGEYLKHPKMPEPRNLLYVNISEGIGLGIIINGEIYYGKDGYAGELGHIYRYDNNILCHCGKKGCLETEVSGRAIRRKIQEAVFNHTPCSLEKKVWNHWDISTSDIVEAAAAGDKLCRGLILRTSTELGKELASLVNILNPDGIIIGGSIAQSPDEFFMAPLRETVRQHTLGLMSRQISITASTLGKNAGIIGACMIARQKTLAQTFEIE